MPLSAAFCVTLLYIELDLSFFAYCFEQFGSGILQIVDEVFTGGASVENGVGGIMRIENK